MSKIKIFPTEEFKKEDILSYVAQLGARLQNTSSCATLSQYDVKINCNTPSTYSLVKYSKMQDICRKLDTKNIKYEVIS
jgi:hypothetical protein